MTIDEVKQHEERILEEFNFKEIRKVDDNKLLLISESDRYLLIFCENSLVICKVIKLEGIDLENLNLFYYVEYGEFVNTIDDIIYLIDETANSKEVNRLEKILVRINSLNSEFNEVELNIIRQLL